ncbi:MAG TPA: hypothetical protein PLM53_15515 [Spirochaetota bacterium]|nr:hypothetical protein [Spirochaetota bacterium]HPC39808.1 hypothetical protein [Spirochaetota bacterium]HPL16326.1 hypothetical protein [Spirochaetota bacterium]HQF09855.1 hypothetical protein [Spirochaetota bacterium]HQH98505.1 hypothetical protein [Spirochaetota bacterium]
MNIKRFIIASIAVFIMIEAIDWLVHGLLLAKWYQDIKGLWRTEMMDLMWVMVLGSLFFSFMFVFIFTKGYEARGVVEGARYGLFIGLLINVSGVLGQYAMYPIPFGLAAIWLAYGMIEMVIAGMITAAIYRT